MRALQALAAGLMVAGTVAIGAPLASAAGPCADPRGNDYCTNNGLVDTQNPTGGNVDTQNPSPGNVNVQNPSAGTVNVQNPSASNVNTQNPSGGTAATQNPSGGNANVANPTASNAAVPVAPAPAARPCTFVLGFATLASLLPQQVGSCTDSESHNPANGDALQHTSGGLLVWRKADNWTAFTNGFQTWINGPYGLAQRLNTQRFPWEADAANYPTAPAQPAQSSASQTTTSSTSAATTTTQSSAPSGSIAGRYQCPSEVLVGYGGQWCNGGEALLVLNANGSYTWGAESGTYTYDGTNVKFSGGLGSATVTNRLLTIRATVSGMQIIYRYVRMGS